MSILVKYNIALLALSSQKNREKSQQFFAYFFLRNSA